MSTVPMKTVRRPFLTARWSNLAILTWEEPPGIVTVRRLRWRGRAQSIEVTGGKPAFRPPEDGVEHFFKEHEWGFGRDRRGRTVAYRVRHPIWDVYPVRSWTLDFDAELVYGSGWNLLSSEKPASVILAPGTAGWGSSPAPRSPGL